MVVVDVAVIGCKQGIVHFSGPAHNGGNLILVGVQNRDYALLPALFHQSWIPTTFPCWFRTQSLGVILVTKAQRYPQAFVTVILILVLHKPPPVVFRFRPAAGDL